MEHRWKQLLLFHRRQQKRYVSGPAAQLRRYLRSMDIVHTAPVCRYVIVQKALEGTHRELPVRVGNCNSSFPFRPGVVENMALSLPQICTRKCLKQSIYQVFFLDMKGHPVDRLEFQRFIMQIYHLAQSVPGR